MQGLNTQLGVFCFANLVIACCSVTAVAATSLFLGSLTPMEAGRLTQRLLKYLFVKVLLVGMVVLPQRLALLHWLPWLAAIGELKLFVGLSKDRLSSLAVTPAAGLSHRARTLCMLLVTLAANALCMAVLWVAQLRQLSRAVCVLFGLDLAITAVDAAKATVSCLALLMDEALAATTAVDLPSTLHGRALAVWERWQGQGREEVLYRLELGADVAMHTLTLVHHVQVWVLHGLSFNLLDALLLLDTRAVVLSILQRLRLHQHHIIATSNIDSAFPDAPKALLAGEEAECVICRDGLASAKQLPCGHMFHLSCLRAWLQQSGGSNFTCPMCRTPLPLAYATAAAAADGGAVQNGTALPASQQPWQSRQQQQHNVLHYNGQSASAASEFMRRISFSLSLDELSGVTSSAQYMQQQQLQLYGRANSLGDDALQQDLLDSPASDMGLRDDLARALAASLQDTGGPGTFADSQHLSSVLHGQSRGNTAASGRSSSSDAGSGSDASASDDAQLSCSTSSGSSSFASSDLSAAIRQRQGAVQSSVPLPPVIFQAAAAAVAAGALDSAEASDGPAPGGFVQQQPQYTLDSGVIAGSGSSSGSFAWLEEEELSDAAERFYSQKYGDPLADSDAAATEARSPGLAAASRVCRTCSRMLVSLISRSPSPRSSTSDPGSAPAAAAVATAADSTALPTSPSAPLHTPSGTAAGASGVLLDSWASSRSSCSGHSSKHGSRCRTCHRQKHCRQQQCEPQETPCQARASWKSNDAADAVLDEGSASKGTCTHLHKHCRSSSCSCRQAGAAQLQQQQHHGQGATTAAGVGARRRALLEKYAVLQVDIAPATDQADSAVLQPAHVAAAAMPAAAAKAAPVSEAGKEPAVLDDCTSVDSTAAAAAVLQLITSPREPHRRRDEGRWGRRRLLGQ